MILLSSLKIVYTELLIAQIFDILAVLALKFLNFSIFVIKLGLKLLDTICLLSYCEGGLMQVHRNFGEVFEIETVHNLIKASILLFLIVSF